jgi:hypothetical protein
MSQGRSVLSSLMMVWMLLIVGVLSYRQVNQNQATPAPATASSAQTVWLR